MGKSFAVRVRGQMNDKVLERIQGLPLAGRVFDRSEYWDISGRSFFRVAVAQVDNPAEAEARVREALADLDGYEVASVEQERGGVITGRYEEIRCRAIEHFVVEAMMGIASEEERIFRVARGMEENPKIQHVGLEGSYPNTLLTVSVNQRSMDRLVESKHAIWKDQEFIKAAETFKGLGRWIGDFLMYQRGG